MLEITIPAGLLDREAHHSPDWERAGAELGNKPVYSFLFALSLGRLHNDPEKNLPGNKSLNTLRNLWNAFHSAEKDYQFTHIQHQTIQCVCQIDKNYFNVEPALSPCFRHCAELFCKNPHSDFLITWFIWSGHALLESSSFFQTINSLLMDNVT